MGTSSSTFRPDEPDQGCTAEDRATEGLEEAEDEDERRRYLIILEALQEALEACEL